MKRRSLAAAGALVAGLGLGAVFGPAAINTPVNAQTQTQQPAPTQQPVQPQAPAQAQPPAAPGTDLRNAFLDKLAATLKIQRSALDTALQQAATGTVDDAVKQGTLTQAQADAIKARIQQGDIDGLWGRPDGPEGPGGRHGGPRDGAVHQAMFDAVAKALGLTSDQLITQLRSGQTLDQLAQAHNTTADAVAKAALTAAKAQLDADVKAGTLTQSQADTIYSRLQQAGTQLLSPRRGGGPGGPHDGQTPPSTPQTPAAPQGTTTSQGL